MKRYYVGYHKKERVYKVFSCAYTPQRCDPHSKPYAFVFGPYPTRKEALQVKGYQSPATVKLADHQE